MLLDEFLLRLLDLAYSAKGRTKIAKFVWSPDGAPPEASPHSVAKLNLIRRYLARYFVVLTANRAIDRQRVTLVDGFCGGGTYSDGVATVDGTPLVLLQVVEEAQRDLNAKRAKPLLIDAQFHFIDSDVDAIDSLRARLAKEGYLGQIGHQIHLQHSTFADAYVGIKRGILSRTRGGVGRSIFVLDQKGYSDAPLGLARDILSSFSGGEVILTFAVGWLIDYLSDKPQTLKAVAPIGLAPEQLGEYLRLKSQKGGRLIIQRLLLRHLKEQTGARYVSPFFIRSQDANKDLWIVHLSNHVTARNVMVDSHWETKNHSWHPGTGGLEILGFDPRLDPDSTPDFWFGEPEADMMRNHLAEDLLRRLRDQFPATPVSYDRFISSIANETPARLSDFQDVASSLIAHRQLRIVGSNGNVRRAARPRKGDFIEIEPQKTFGF